MSLLEDAHGHLRPGWKALLFTLAYPLALLVASLPLVPFFRDRPPLLPSKLLEAAVALGLTWAFLRGDDKPLADVGLARNRRWVRECLLGMAWGAGLQVAAAGLVWVSGGVGWELGGATPGAFLGVFVLLMAVALHEELIFRGYPFQRLVESWGFWPTQVVVGLGFAAIHLGNPNQTGAIRLWSTANIALAGLLFGAMWRASGSLALAIGTHFAWNFVQGPILGFGVSGQHLPSLLRAVPAPGRALWVHGGPFGLEATLACALVCGAGVTFWALKRPGVNCPSGEAGNCT